MNRLRLVLQRFRPRSETSPGTNSEQKPSWYDSLYSQGRTYHEPYYRSHYYFLHFRHSDEVRAHYASFFHELDVVAFTSPDSTPSAIDVFFLADGVRNEFPGFRTGEGP